VDPAGACAVLPYDVDYSFSCPGTYRIDIVDPLWPDFPRSTSVTVTEPPKFWLFVFAGYTDHDVYLGTHYSSAERPFSVSTVDWGDGVVETFAYSPRGLYKGTPNHLYKADGEYTASVTHHYFGNYCTWDQTVTTVVKVPTVTTAMQPTTWGSVKAMYRD
jgi:hypothetical protein